MVAHKGGAARFPVRPGATGEACPRIPAGHRCGRGIGLFKLLRPCGRWPNSSSSTCTTSNPTWRDSCVMAVRADPADSVSPRPLASSAGKKALSIVDRVWVCSNEDRDRLCGPCPADVPIHVVPNGIPHAGDIPETLPADPSSGNGFPVILFVGHLGYAPNVDAAERLAGAILPRIRRAFPTRGWYLVGVTRSPPCRRWPACRASSLLRIPQTWRRCFQRRISASSRSPREAARASRFLEAMAWACR